jgi:hypothetical protein
MNIGGKSMRAQLAHLIGYNCRASLVRALRKLILMRFVNLQSLAMARNDGAIIALEVCMIYWK